MLRKMLIFVLPLLLLAECGGTRITSNYKKPSTEGGLSLESSTSSLNFQKSYEFETPVKVHRAHHTATLLSDGKVLIAGGIDINGVVIAQAELYDPAAGTFSVTTGALHTARTYHTATLLSNGKVLIAGGDDNSGVVIAQAELYDPVAKTFSIVGDLSPARTLHTATLLSNGTVLIAGGVDSGGAVMASAELYDPAAGTFSATTGALHTVRYQHTATLLPNGKVLITGGNDNGAGVIAQAELYNPTTKIFSVTTGHLNTARALHTATLLLNGKVLIAGGRDNSFALTSAELYNPATEEFGNISGVLGHLNTERGYHTATLLSDGKVLIAGGFDSGWSLIAQAELYDPVAGVAGTFSVTTGGLNTARVYHTAILLADGKVLIAGGNGNSGVLTSAELYNPNDQRFYSITAGDLNTPRGYHTATLLSDGKVLIAGGYVSGATAIASAELYDPVAGVDGTFSVTTGSLNTARASHTATLLADGKVLIAGGNNGGGTVIAQAELYDPATQTFIDTTGSLNTARTYHTATLLSTGKVLIAGGYDVYGASTTALAELYDPVAGTFSVTTGGLNTARVYHTATLLSNGKVLIAGGDDISGTILTSAEELYDPVAGTFSAATGSLNLARSNHTATLLSDGKVLIVGGMGNSGALTSAELYDPVAGTFSAATGSLNTARYNHTATLLSDGKVLIAGGNDNGGAVIASAELYDPTTQTFSAVGDLNTVRNYHTATLLSDGKVLIAGGYASGWTEIAPSERFICTIHGAYQVKFTATGGEESYTYSIVDGTGAIDPVTGDYSAQWATGDTVVIEVTDNKGNRATRTITLNIS